MKRIIIFLTFFFALFCFDFESRAYEGDYAYIDSLTPFAEYKLDTYNGVDYETKQLIYLGSQSQPVVDVNYYVVNSDLSDYDQGVVEGDSLMGIFFQSDHKMTVPLTFVNMYWYDGQWRVGSVGEGTYEVSEQWTNARQEGWATADYWDDYASQFLGKDETLDRLHGQLKNYYFGWYYTQGGETKNPDDEEMRCGAGGISIYPLHPDGTKRAGISTLEASTFLANTMYVAPFFYVPDGLSSSPWLPADDYGEHNNFVCYLEVTTVWKSFSLRNNLRFYWDVEKFPQLQGCNIELRAIDTGLRANDDNWFWFSSIDSSNKKEDQTDFYDFKFDYGEAVVCDYTLDKYYQSWIEKWSEIFAPYNDGKYRFQLRAIKSDMSVYTDWITFDLNDLTENTYTSSIYDKDGNDTGTSIYDNEAYDEDFANNKGTKRDTSDPSYHPWGVDQYSGETADLTSFMGWINNAVNSIGDFPHLLAICYSFLPSNLIYLIVVSFSLLIIVRILGR